MRITAHELERLRQKEEDFVRLGQMELEAKQIRGRLDRIRRFQYVHIDLIGPMGVASNSSVTKMQRV